MTSAKKATIIKESQYELPFDIWDSDTACALFEFYLYNMATVDISPLSYNLQQKLNDAQKQDLLQKMLNDANCTADDFIYGKFLNNQLKEIERYMDCSQFKGHKNKSLS